MSMSKGAAHALDYDFGLVPPAVIAPLQRRLEEGLRQTLSVLLGNDVSELAWERAKLPTCFGGLGIKITQMGYAAQATYWPAVDLRKAVIKEHKRSTEQTNTREVATALAAKTDLLSSGVAVDKHARVTIESEASKLYEAPWAADKRAAEIARLLCIRLTAFRRRAWLGTWRSLSYNRGFCRLRKRCRLRSYTVKCFLNSRPSCSVREDLALARAGRPCAKEDGHGVTAWCSAGCWPALHVRSEERQGWGHLRAFSCDASAPLFLLPARGSHDQTAPCGPAHPAPAH